MSNKTGTFLAGLFISLGAGIHFGVFQGNYSAGAFMFCFLFGTLGLHKCE